MGGKITRQCFRGQDTRENRIADDETVEVVIWDKQKLITKRTRLFDLLSEDD
jgi:hypothetical protein